MMWIRESAPLGLPFALLALFFVLRAFYIQSGHFKSPLLRTFEMYGQTPPLYNSLRSFALWSGLAWLSAALGLTQWLELDGRAALPGLLLLFVAWIAHQTGGWIYRHLPLLMPAPRWYTDLIARTTPYERRRIAYHWLRLSRAMRQRLSHHDSVFQSWVDLVIVATF